MLQACFSQPARLASSQQLSVRSLFIHRAFQHSGRPVLWSSNQSRPLVVAGRCASMQQAAQPVAEGQLKRARPEDTNEAAPAQDEQEPQGKKGRKGKQGKGMNETTQMIRAIHEAAKEKSLSQALATYRAAKEASIQLPASNFNTLLYLTVGGDYWEHLARGGEPNASALLNVSGGVQLPTVLPAAATPPPAAEEQQPNGGASDGQGPPDAENTGDMLSSSISKEDRVSLANEMYDTMLKNGHKPDLVALLALARLEGIQGNPDKALEWVHTCKAHGHQLSLRMFQPALVGYCMTHNIKGLDTVRQLLKDNDLDLTEYEFSRLIEGYASDPAGCWAQLKEVLDQMTKEMEHLSPQTIELLATFFRSAQSQAALPASHDKGQAAGWKMDVVQVDPTGYSSVAGDKLKVVDLEDAEWDSFAEGVASLALKNEKAASQFDDYVKWYDKYGPYDILLDGANIAFFGQGGNFNWKQIIAMWDKVNAEHPGSKPLLMMHVRRTNDPPAQTPQVQAFIDKLRKSRSFYSTPPGSNDDWYWMYATVKARQKGLLISNDELRDHIFSLLRPKHFLKWKARHIAHYTFQDKRHPVLEYPAAFTSCVQQLDNGTWMFPCSQGDNWLCVKPA